MKKTVRAWALVGGVAFGCGGEGITQLPETESVAPSPAPAVAGLVRRAIPDEDPGPPYYARVGVQFYVDDGLLAIPFYRDPGCIPPAFNLLEFFHFPGADGPGAFACPLLVEGFLQTEADAGPGTFPRRVELRGRDVPLWFVDARRFEEAAGDGVVTVSELEALGPSRGVASSFAETLHPREEDHLVVIRARGRVDGRRFRFGVTDVRHDVRRVEIVWFEGGRAADLDGGEAG